MLKPTFQKQFTPASRDWDFKVSSLSWKRQFCSGLGTIAVTMPFPIDTLTPPLPPRCWSLNNWAGDTRKSSSSLRFPSPWCELLRATSPLGLPERCKGWDHICSLMHMGKQGCVTSVHQRSMLWLEMCCSAQHSRPQTAQRPARISPALISLLWDKSRGSAG